ncbi:MAG: hypothetical protein ACKORL_09920 [Phycisphaerales bacterium]
MRNPSISPRLSIAALLAAGLCQATALGQDALGGNVLQRARARASAPWPRGSRC